MLSAGRAKEERMIILRGAGFDIIQEEDGYWEIDYDCQDGIPYEERIPLTEEEVNEILRRYDNGRSKI